MKKVYFFWMSFFIYSGCFAQFGGSQGGNRPPVGGNTSLPPAGTNVIVYQNMKYSGMSRALGEGSFSGNNLGFLGGNVSSIYIPPGNTVTVYDNRGQARTFNTSVANLAQYGWDNKIASGVIRRGNPGNGGSGGSHGGNGVTPGPPPPKVIAYLFTDSKYRGRIIPLSSGRFPHLGITGDRAVSSIQVAPGFGVRVYSSANLKGHFRVFTGSISNLASYGWNDLIRSVEIVRM